MLFMLNSLVFILNIRIIFELHVYLGLLLLAVVSEPQVFFFMFSMFDIRNRLSNLIRCLVCLFNPMGSTFRPSGFRN